MSRQLVKIAWAGAAAALLVGPVAAASASPIDPTPSGTTQAPTSQELSQVANYLSSAHNKQFQPAINWLRTQALAKR